MTARSEGYTTSPSGNTLATTIAGLARSAVVAAITLAAWTAIAIYALKHRGQFILGM